ncbi:MAG: biotin--protein ligase [Rhodanobacteraceae bacterium]|nr:MAG: biotin--protein ligase [Rhodanobacteraceae bacterium]
MHGEYKMSGGKLVVADLEVDAGRLCRVQISGDFFLEPDSALDVINAALEGQPAGADATQLAHAVERRLEAGMVLYGISPAAVATAVRRALGDAA